MRKNKFLAGFLAFVMLLTFIPTTALAEETAGNEPETEQTAPVEETEAPDSGEEVPGGSGAEEEPVEPTEAELLQARIDALPEAEAVEALMESDPDAVGTVYAEVRGLMEAVGALDGELDTAKLDALMALFTPEAELLEASGTGTKDDPYVVATAKELTAAVEKGGYIKLNADITANVVIPASKEVTLDLNGKKLTNDAASEVKDTIYVTKEATLTVVGSGTVDNVSNGRAAVFNNGTAILNGGSYTRSKEAGTNAGANGNSWYVLLNHGTMTISGDVAVTSKSTYSSMIENGYQKYSSSDERTGHVSGTNAENPSLTIESGTFTGGKNTIKNDDGGTVSISGGTFSNTDQAAVLNWNVAEISGGEFNVQTNHAVVLNGRDTSNTAGDECLNQGKLTITDGTFTSTGSTAIGTMNGASGDMGTVEISGGTFTASGGSTVINKQGAEGATVQVTGGTFSNDVKDYVPAGSTTVQDENGKYTIGVADNAVAQIGSVGYTTLSEAIKVAKDGDTVKLLKSVENSSELIEFEKTADTAVTLDLGGNTYTKTSGNRGSVIVVKGGKLTIQNGTIKTTGLSASDNGAVSVEADYSAEQSNKVNATVVIAKDAVIESSSYAGVGVFGNVAQADIYGTVKGLYYGVAGNGTKNATTNNGGTLINVYDGANITHTDANDGVGIFQSQLGTLNIEGGNITGLVGVQICAGTANISGGTITATGTNTLTDYTYAASGNVLDGAALSVINRSGYQGDIQVAVTGGKFVSEKGDALLEYTSNGDCNHVKSIEIKDGEFIGASGSAAINVQLKNSATKIPVVSGGSFSTVVSAEFCAEGYQPTTTLDENGRYTVEINTDADVFVARIGKKGYKTLQEAVDAANDNDTVVLLQDVDLTAPVTVTDKTITLDLAQHKIYNTQDIWKESEGKWSLISVGANGNLTIKGSGTMQAKENDCYAVDLQDGGKCTIENGTFTGNVHAVYVLEGELTVKGGHFSVQQKYSTAQPDDFVLNCLDANFKNGTAKITVTGGTFEGFDPMHSKSEPTTDGQATTSFIPEGLATTKDEQGNVTVVTASVSVSPASSSVKVGKTLALTMTVTPSELESYGVVEWTSSDKKIASVDEKGVVTGVASGDAVITVTITDQGKVVCSDSCTVSVYKKSSSGGGSGSGSSSYSITVEKSKHGDVTVSPKSASKGDTVTITVKPDKGYELDELTVTDKNGDSVKLKKKSDTKYTFTMPASKVEVEAVFAKVEEQVNFIDVPDGYWAEDAIDWAFEKGYMNGTSADTFNPGGDVSRQQLWMILARLSGQRPADMAEARSWAVDNGVSDGTFPGRAVSRQQLVTILYRYAARMGYKTSGAADLTRFPDHASVAAYARDAMSWSVANDIVGGTAQGTLNSTGTATRAQFAVILSRFCENIVG